MLMLLVTLQTLITLKIIERRVKSIYNWPRVHVQGKDHLMLNEMPPPNGSITSQMLRDAVHTLAHHRIFDCSNQKIPFLLFDGHSRRFNVVFLNYFAIIGHINFDGFSIKFI